MPVLTIDGQQVEVPTGTKVIDAAEQLGIMIPRFCYLKSLGAVGACRMCAVKFLDGHKKDLDMSCMVDARDGMVISTDHADAIAFRAQVIEWLMLSHPHDCPICDEGGHCLLQDMTVSGGHGRRNYRGLKRTYENQDLGPLIEHEMNRCIHCYRCVRFYREYAGGDDYGTFGIAGRVTYQRFEPGKLESPFSGNLGEICPTGTLTDKPARYRARRWDLERSPSICSHCSLGCNTFPAVRYREVLRVESRPNETLNGDFICDRGRYGFGYASMPERPRHPVVDGTSVSPEQAATQANERIRQLIEKHGPQAVAVHISARCTLEEMHAAQALARGLDLRSPTFFLTEEERLGSLEAASTLTDDVSCSLKQVREADMILVLGADPLQEAPMTALAIRQAARNGALIGVLDPRPVNLLCETVSLPLSRHHIPAAINALLEHAFKDTEFYDDASSFYGRLKDIAATEKEVLAPHQELLQTLAGALRTACRPVLICSSDTMLPGWLSLTTGLARLLRQTGNEDHTVDARVFCLLPRANSMGAALLAGKDARSLEQTLDVEENDVPVKGLICIGADPLSQLPPLPQTVERLEKLDLLICMDCTPSLTWQKADISFPTKTLFETGGCLVNNTGYLQRVTPVFKGGSPIQQTGANSHPPRIHTAQIPGNATQTARQWAESILSSPIRMTEDEESLCALMLQATPEKSISALPRDTHQAFPSLSSLATAMTRPEGSEQGEVLITGSVFGSDRLANLGELGQQLLPAPEIWVHTDLATTLGLEENQMVLVPLAHGVARGILRCSRNMNTLTVVLAKTPASDWQRAGKQAVSFDIKRIWREQADQDAVAAADFDPDISCQGGRL